MSGIKNPKLIAYLATKKGFTKKTAFQSGDVSNKLTGKNTLAKKNSNKDFIPKVMLGISASIFALPMMGHAQGGCGTANGVASDPGGGNNGGAGIDVDGDGNDDFTFSVYSAAGNDVYINPKGQFSVAVSGAQNNGYDQAADLSAGATVDENLTWSTAAFVNFLNGNPGANWDHNGDTGYLGIRVPDGMGGFFYGFIEITVASPFTSGADITADVNDTGLSSSVNQAAETGDCTSLALPVELLSFTAAADKGHILLNWRTASELDNAGFEVQRSLDGEQFKTLSFIAGNGTTFNSQAYAYTDKTAKAGQRYYYRLRQIDYNGEFSFSPVQTALIDKGAPIAGTFYPNPVQNGLTRLNYSTSESGKLYLQVFDAAAKQIMNKTVNVDEGDSSINLDFSNLATGIYFVKMEQGSFSSYQKLVIE